MVIVGVWIARTPSMITKFDSSYYGTADMENLGYAGTPINERCYSKEELAKALHKVVTYAKCMDERGYNTFWMAEHHFQPEGTELIPNLLMMAMHLCGVTKNLKIGCGFNIVPMWHPLRLSEDYAMADVLTGGRVIFGVGRGYHTREVEIFGAPLIDQNANREMFEEGVGIRGQAVLAPGQVLDDPAGGAVSRLHLEGDHVGAGAAAAAGRMLERAPGRRPGARRRHPGSRRRGRRAGVDPRSLPLAAPRLRRWRLCWRKAGDEARRDGAVDACHRQATRSGHRLLPASSALGRRANRRLAWPQPAAGKRLRGDDRQRRGMAVSGIGPALGAPSCTARIPLIDT